MKNLNVMYSSNSDEWTTPQSLFEELDREFHFDLDAAASDLNHKCSRYFTKETDGITQNWGGGVEYFLIHLTARLRSGLQKLVMRLSRIIHLLSCLYQQEQTQSIFTTTYLEGLRLDLSKAALSLVTVRIVHHFQAC